MNSFLVLPNNVSRSTAVGAILQPGGPMPTAGGSVGTGMPDEGVGRETDFVLAMGRDEKLLRRLNELEDAETCSTNKKGTNAKWQCDPANARAALWQFTSVVSP
jgi:trehalose 6-phosphate synthase complex regulatory subunit